MEFDRLETNEFSNGLSPEPYFKVTVEELELAHAGLSHGRRNDLLDRLRRDYEALNTSIGREAANAVVEGNLIMLETIPGAPPLNVTYGKIASAVDTGLEARIKAREAIHALNNGTNS